MWRREHHNSETDDNQPLPRVRYSANMEARLVRTSLRQTETMFESKKMSTRKKKKQRSTTSSTNKISSFVGSESLLTRCVPPGALASVLFSLSLSLSARKKKRKTMSRERSQFVHCVLSWEGNGALSTRTKDGMRRSNRRTPRSPRRSLRYCRARRPLDLNEECRTIKLACKYHSEYAPYENISRTDRETKKGQAVREENGDASSKTVDAVVDTLKRRRAEKESLEKSQAIVAYEEKRDQSKVNEMFIPKTQAHALALRKRNAVQKPKWHPKWKLMRVVSGHLGWVRSVAVEPGNEWFATGSGDRTIKIWNLASGQLKLTLTGHIHSVRGLAVSPRHPYLFSAGEDKQVMCWDLESNKVIRHYHGHLSGVWCVDIHPTLDLLVTGGRDSVARVWDMRTKHQIMALGGHKSTVATVLTQTSDPQVVTGSMDKTIRLWDIRKGVATMTLTHHKKGIRSLVGHPTQFCMASGAADNIKKWRFPKGSLMKNFSGHNAIVNSLSVNEDDVLVSCADDGSMKFWDWNTGYNFQTLRTAAQPGSLDSERAIYASTFDKSGSRLITCEADKTIKFWKEDEASTEESDPIDMAQWTADSKKRKRH